MSRRTVAALGGALAALPLTHCDRSGRSARPGRGDKMPIIDVHVHAHPADRFGKPGPPNPITGEPSKAVTNEALIAETLAAMDRHNIVKAVAFSGLESVARWKKAAPDRFIGGVQLDVGLPMPPIDEVRAAIRAGQLGIIGEIGAQYMGMAPGDEALEPYLALAVEMDVPVGFHTGLGAPNTPYECCPKFRTTLGNPALVEEVLIRHPKMRPYLMHAGWPNLAQTISILYVYPQVYADISVINWILPREEFHEYLRSLVRAGLGDRLMFGSDQMVWPEAIDTAVEAVETATFLTAAQRQAIFYDNAARFFRLEPARR